MNTGPFLYNNVSSQGLSNAGLLVSKVTTLLNEEHEYESNPGLQGARLKWHLIDLYTERWYWSQMNNILYQGPLII
jgi:hypothetical protein